MALAPDTKLGRYEIRQLLGAGGMGEVYLARDTSLNRSVAVKLLPPDLSHNRDRLRRFEQEALAVAALNHPNIAHIYEIGEAEGSRFIAMEYVDGVTLTDKIHRQKTPLKKLLKYLTQAADGIAKAHAAGIVHRDLKPDNIMVTSDDYAKVLDFGLAKLIEPQNSSNQGKTASDESATAILEQPLSTPGMIMGTVGYMSPEQAQGRGGDIDHRSDIFSFGCIVYEAATGRRAFEGTDQIDTLHKIVHSPVPRIDEYNPNAPAELQRILRRCLAKDPEDRFQTIKDVAIELRDIRREMDSELHSVTSAGEMAARSSSGPGTMADLTGAVSTAEVSGTSTVTSPSSAEYVVGGIRRHKALAAVVLSLLIVAGLGLAFGAYKYFAGQNGSTPAPQMNVRRLTSTGKVNQAAISPDGKHMAHVVDEAGRQSLWVRQVATASDINIIPPAEAQFRGLTFSQDGNYVYYIRYEGAGSRGTIFQIPAFGGASKKILEGQFTSIAISPDGKQLAYYRYDPNKGAIELMIAPIDGSSERSVAMRNDTDGFDGGLAWSPDGKMLACADFQGGGAEGIALVAISAQDGTAETITTKKWGSVRSIAWLSDGSGMLVAGADRSSGYFFQISHVSYPDGAVRRVTNDLNNYANVSLTADDTTIVTVQGDWISSLWVAPDGDSGKSKRITSGKYDGGVGVAWTPDGRIVHASRNWELNIANADGTGQRLLTPDEPNNRWVSVTPDGKYLLFESWRDDPGEATLWRMEIDGRNPTPLTGKEWASSPYPSPDSSWIVYESNALGKWSIWRASIDGSDRKPLTDKTTDEPAISPDGQLVACFYYPEGQTAKIAVFPAEGGEPVHVFDVDKGVRDKTPRWTADGKAITYVVNSGGVSNIWSQPLAGGPPKQVTDFESDTIFAFDWSRDGKQLLLSRGNITNDVVMITDFK